jgi:hypothetical protein
VKELAMETKDFGLLKIAERLSLMLYAKLVTNLVTVLDLGVLMGTAP